MTRACRNPRTVLVATTVAGLIAAGVPAPGAAQSPEPAPHLPTSDRCIACHQGVTDRAGRDVSIGFDWRASMMAHSAVDPYWRAAVRREITDHPAARAAIEDECSRCHMPMASVTARARGLEGKVFTGGGASAPGHPALARDGVSCALCHRIAPDGLGSEESFTGGFELGSGAGAPPAYGPFEVDDGRRRIMRSAIGLDPTGSDHVSSSELCATCHTLYTHALGADGAVVGELPEQVPYLEWRHSAFPGEGRGCVSCHMPVVEGEVPVTGVLGEPRTGVSRHVFRGGNFFVLGMFGRYADELGTGALPQELDAAVARTREHLGSRAATLRIVDPALRDGRLVATVVVENLAGHKLPTAYPSRRAWLHLTVRDATGAAVFESGAPRPDGSIAGNDNDADPERFEPHHRVVRAPEEVQVWEAILADPDGRVTTGLLRAVTYAKDNRIPPRGFEPATAGADIAVHGAAAADPDFAGGGDRVLYDIPLGDATGPFRVEAELLYQPIGFRWAKNLAPYATPETDRFTRMYREMADVSHAFLARAAAEVGG